MSAPVIESPLRAMHIGLVAYGIDGPHPSLVFVRVPTERGRWVLTDRCVVEVACRLCGAVVGEPCRRSWKHNRVLQHGAGTHWHRRDDWQQIKHKHKWRAVPKLRIRFQDVELAQQEADADE